MSSVSRVLAEHPDVSERMRTRVLAAVRELGYRPDMLAQGLRRQRTMSIGFTVSDISNPVLADTITGAERRLRGSGYSLLLTDSEGDAALDAEHIHLLEQRRVDGLIVSLVNEYDADTADALGGLEVPVVLLDRDNVPGVATRRVCFDHTLGMGAATRALLEFGHREFAFIAGGPQRPARQRLEGIDDCIARSGLTARCRRLAGDFSIEHGERATRQVLEHWPEVTAVIAGGNLIMHGALRALRDAGLQLGADMSLVGCDDVAVAEFHHPPIAVVRRDTRASGDHAAQMLIHALAGGEYDADIVLPTEFVARPSCAPPRLGALDPGR